jgi:hypothetical protein
MASYKRMDELVDERAKVGSVYLAKWNGTNLEYSGIV